MRLALTRSQPPEMGRVGEVCRRPTAGQALTEFAFMLIPFLFVLLGTFDLGRGVYTYNAVAEAAREIARVAIVHPGSPLGSSAEAQATISAQRRTVPGLTAGGIAISCVDLADQPVTNACRPGDYVKVSVTVSWAPVTPLLAAIGLHELSSVSRMQFP